MWPFQQAKARVGWHFLHIALRAITLPANRSLSRRSDTCARCSHEDLSRQERWREMDVWAWNTSIKPPKLKQTQAIRLWGRWVAIYEAVEEQGHHTGSKHNSKWTIMVLSVFWMCVNRQLFGNLCLDICGMGWINDKLQSNMQLSANKQHQHNRKPALPCRLALYWLVCSTWCSSN